jgi:aspartyl-tRNA(Asn)/glutamyl-tRNA(Gln) amidotransferase subunit C
MDTRELEITAELAQLELTPAEKQRLGQEVDQMLAYFDKMKEVNTEGLEPTTHAFVKANRTRPDSLVASSRAELILEQAPELEDRFIVIPNVL